MPRLDFDDRELDALAERIAERLAQRIAPPPVREPAKEGGLNIKQAAAYLGIGHSTLERCRTLGTGPRAIKIGRSVRYTRAELDAWSAKRKEK